jgi:hypothetical protein
MDGKPLRPFAETAAIREFATGAGSAGATLAQLPERSVNLSTRYRAR